MGRQTLARTLAAVAMAGGCRAATAAATAAATVQMLAPAADTYVCAGRQADRDHGRSSRLKVQATRRVAYLRFDLSALPAPIGRATLVLWAVDGSRDGGTVYRVADTGWLEGRGTERVASGGGLRFVDVDTNGDGRLDGGDASPLAPAGGGVVAAVGRARRGRAVRVDVTDAVAGGPGVYTLAIASASADAAAYASREYRAAARRPMLEVVLGDPGASASTAGRANVFCIADSGFDRFTSRPTPDAQAWMRDHYWRMLAHAPYFDTRLSWYSAAWVYKDLYAIYTGSTLAARHADWILRDRDGRELFIPWGCAGGTCPQYAGDPGNTDFRAQWIGDARQALTSGYEGLYVDDVNLFLSRVGTGSGEPAVPVDPRTGRDMTERDWRRYMAEFVEAIRTAFPGVEIVHNAIWYVGDDDPYVARQVAAADYQLLERGVNDAGLVGGPGPYGFDTFLGHLDFVHAAGGGFLLDGQGADLGGRQYSLAAYLLAKRDRDGITHDHGTTPEDWWAPGWELTLGTALGGRYAWNGLWRRDFTGGFVVVNPPGAPSRSVALGGPFRDLTGGVRTSIVLGPAEGAVLRAEDRALHPHDSP